jgi:hypothetical protein
MACPVYGQTGEAIELLFGSGVFRFVGRLTVIRGARKIIRIRTKCPTAEDNVLAAEVTV